nr:RNA-dependent helicase [Cryptomonas paramecium]
MEINKKNFVVKTYKNFLFQKKKSKDMWLFTIVKENVITKHTFELLLISKLTMLKLLEQHYTHMTNIQSLGIPLQICGFDILGSAQTGSGKTITFCVPLIEFVHTVKWTKFNNLAGIILTPTRELTLQNYCVIKDLLALHSQSCGILMGGTNKKTEIEKIKKGQSIIIATPGRLLDHLTSKCNFPIKFLQILIIDEADRCLEAGFEEEIYKIISIFPKKRQTILFSATQTRSVESLSVISFVTKPIYLSTQTSLSVNAIPNIEQNFLICKPEYKFISLVSFLKKNENKKIVVFFNSCNEVRFFSILSKLLGISVLNFHGKQKQVKRTSVFFEFCKKKKSILFCTDVASRGLDIPSIDWVIHFDAPLEIRNYFHRIGRTCRGIETVGKSLIFLLPSEINFLILLKKNKIKISEYKFQNENLFVMCCKLIEIIKKNNYLSELSKEAFKSFLNSYSNSNLKEVFDVKKIDLRLLAKSFGLKI